MKIFIIIFLSFNIEYMAYSNFLAFVILEFFVLGNWLFYLGIHCINKKLRLLPGNLIAWEIVAVLIFISVIIYQDLNLFLYSYLTRTDCTIGNYLYAYSILLKSLYSFCLCYEIYSIAKNPIDNKYSKRANFYHVLS